jgi:hypothetical protein
MRLFFELVRTVLLNQGINADRRLVFSLILEVLVLLCRCCLHELLERFKISFYFLLNLIVHRLRELLRKLVEQLVLTRSRCLTQSYKLSLILVLNHLALDLLLCAH